MNYAPIQRGLIYNFTSEKEVIFLYLFHCAALVQHASCTLEVSGETGPRLPYREHWILLQMRSSTRSMTSLHHI